VGVGVGDRAAQAQAQYDSFQRPLGGPATDVYAAGHYDRPDGHVAEGIWQCSDCGFVRAKDNTCPSCGEELFPAWETPAGSLRPVGAEAGAGTGTGTGAGAGAGTAGAGVGAMVSYSQGTPRHHSFDYNGDSTDLYNSDGSLRSSAYASALDVQWIAKDALTLTGSVHLSAPDGKGGGSGASEGGGKGDTLTTGLYCDPERITQHPRLVDAKALMRGASAHAYAQLDDVQMASKAPPSTPAKAGGPGNG